MPAVTPPDWAYKAFLGIIGAPLQTNVSLNNMWQIASTLLNICLLRRGPQDLPYSKLLLLVVATVFVIFTARILSVALALQLAITLALVSVATTAALLYLILNYLKFTNRLVQIMTSLIGVDLILITSMAILRLGIIVPNKNIALIMISIVMCWQLIIYSHMFVHGLMMRRLYASLMAIAYSVVHGSAANFIAKLIAS